MQTAAQNDVRYHYRVYGITLAADRQIPGLEAEAIARDCTVDIGISFGPAPPDLEYLMAHCSNPYYVQPGNQQDDPLHLLVTTASEGRHYRLTYAGVVTFTIDAGAALVWCQWRDTLTLEDVALYLLGPVMGFMLRLRGTTCLHASGVLVNGGAIAITGASGSGKSTLAASFAAAGYPILTDDVLPLTDVDGTIHTESGYSRLRLFPSSFQNLPELPDELPRLAPGWNKCFLDLASQQFRLHRDRAPLRMVYLVDWAAGNRSAPSIIPVSATAAVPLLAANTYRTELLSTPMRQQEFHFLGCVAATVKVRRLCPVDDISTIPLLRDMLLADFERETGPASSRTISKTGSNAGK